MNFRREFGAVSGLSVLLVIGTALLLGLFFALAIPGLGFAWGVALGAIISPTDAVATSIVKRTPVSRRVVSILDGESLLNDATALVLLRTAVVTTAAAFSFWGAVGTLAYSVVVALAVGWAVGRLDLLVRKRVTDPTVNTVISFTAPFLASVPAEHLGASGLVAAVVAGLVTGIRAPRDLSPRNRLSDSQNWRTVELVLEGAVFLTMGVQIGPIVADVRADYDEIGTAVLVAAAALALTVLVRAAYIGPLLAVLAARARGSDTIRTRVRGLQERMSTPEGKQQTMDEAKLRGRPPKERDLDRFAGRIVRILADLDYFRREVLGWREGTAVVWAGMRGAVTVAAAQTLPEDTPRRSVLVLIAFAVALLSLLVQGGTIGPLLRRLTPAADHVAAARRASAERDRIAEIMRTTSATAHPDATSSPASAHRLAVISAQRSALLDARDNGTFDAEVLEEALADLDAAQIAIELRGGLRG